MKKHLGVLEDWARQRREVGRALRGSLGPKRLEDLQAWMNSYRQWWSSLRPDGLLAEQAD
jgi:hypothetical protein